jgi:hypothetical protein
MARRNSKYSKADCSQSDFDRSKAVQIGNGTSFREEITGQRKKLVVYNKIIKTTVVKSGFDLGGLKNERFSAFLGRFNKQLYKRFRTMPHLYDIDIKWKGSVSGSNKEIWKKINVGDIFYCVDLKSAYWQFGFRLGYINPEFFDQYMYDDLFKVSKRLCFSFLSRGCRAIYHSPRKSVEIKCETAPLKKVFDNTRYELYNKISEARSGLKTAIEWATDAICVLPEELDVLRKKFDDLGLIYKTTLCRKLSENEYQQGSKIKNF